jgi:hypothetical protein
MPFHRPDWFVLNFQNAAGRIIFHHVSATNSTTRWTHRNRKVAEVRYLQRDFAINVPMLKKLLFSAKNLSR